MASFISRRSMQVASSMIIIGHLFVECVLSVRNGTPRPHSMLHCSQEPVSRSAGVSPSAAGAIVLIQNEGGVDGRRQTQDVGIYAGCPGEDRGRCRGRGLSG